MTDAMLRQRQVNVTAIAARKRAATHCKRDHEFTVPNTFWRKDGRRSCRTCMNDRRWYSRRGLVYQ